MKSSNHEVVEASAFRLVDGGRVRAELGMLGPLAVGLTLYDVDGTKRAVLQASDSGRTRLDLAGDDGSIRIELATDMRGTPTIALNDKQGKPCLELSLDTDLATIAVRNQAARTQLLMQVDNGAPTLILADGDGRHRIVAKVQRDNRIGLAMYGRETQARFLIGVDEDDNPQVRLLDPAGHEAIATAKMADGRLRIEHESS